MNRNEQDLETTKSLYELFSLFLLLVKFFYSIFSYYFL